MERFKLVSLVLFKGKGWLKMDFKLNNGPWTQLSSGSMQGHEVEIYANPDSLVLAMVFDSEEGVHKGALLECYKVFHCKGNIEAFVETLPRRALTITKHTAKETFKFLLLDSGSTYASYDEESFVRETDALISKIKPFSSLVQEVSSAYDLDLVELKNCADQEKLAFFTIPIIGLLISPAVKRKEETLRVELGHGEIMLGITKLGTIVKEPFDFFEKTIVCGNTKSGRMHAFHILIESTLLSNMPAIIIDWDSLFAGLHFPNEEIAELKKYNVGLDPLGFPIKVFKPGTDLKADLEFLDPKTFLAAFGLLDKPQGIIIEQAFALGKSADIFQLIDRVNAIPEGEHVTPFKKREAARILMLIDSIYPGLFTGTNPIKEIAEGWLKGIGRANILEMERTDIRKNLLILQSIISGVLEFFRSAGKSEMLKAMVFVTDSEIVVPAFKANAAHKRIALDISQLREYGVGYALELRDKVNLAKELKSQVQAAITLIEKNDAGVIVERRKNYRVLLRPGLSKCTELRIEEAKALTPVKI
ncbi:MAG: hypothetical protein QXK06_00095 [Candidatus Diapherotrites archaeon]